MSLYIPDSLSKRINIRQVQRMKKISGKLRTLNNKPVGKVDLGFKQFAFKYINKDGLSPEDLKFTELEKELSDILSMKPNTIDILNENLKLKEALRFYKDEFKHKMRELHQETRDAEQKMKELRGKDDSMAAENGDLKDQLIKLQEIIEANKADYDDLYSMLYEKEKEMEKANKHLEELLAEKKLLLEDNRRLQDEKQEVDKENWDLRKKLSDLENDWNDRMEVIRKDVAKKENDLLARDERIRDLEDDVDRLDKELGRKNEEFRGKYDSGLATDLFTKGEELKIKDKTIEDLRNKLREAQAQKGDVQNKLDFEEQNAIGLKKRINELERNMNQKDKEAGNLRRKNDELGIENEDLRNQLDNADMAEGNEEVKQASRGGPSGPDMLEVLEANKNFQNELEQKMKDIGQLMDELDEVKNREKLAKKENELLEQDKEDLRMNLRKAQADLENKIKELNQARGDRADLEKELEELKNMIRDKNKEVELTKKDLNNEELRNKSLRTENDELEHKNGELEREIEGLKRKLRDLNEDMERVQKDKDRLSEDLRNLEEDEKENKKIILDLERKTMLLKDNPKMREELLKAKKYLDDVEDQLAQAKKRNKELTMDNMELEDQVNRLKDELDRLKKKLNDNSGDSKMVKQMQEKMERNLKVILDKTAIVYKKSWYLNELANDNDPEETDIPTVNTSLVGVTRFPAKSTSCRSSTCSRKRTVNSPRKRRASKCSCAPGSTCRRKATSWS